MQANSRNTHASDASIAYSNLEVSTNPFAAHKLVVGQDINGQPVHYYVPIIENQTSLPEVIAVENYHNPAPFVRPSSADGKIVNFDDVKILTFGDELSPEVVSTPYDAQSPFSPAICGIRRKTFWIVVVAVGFVAIVAAIGGGVGGYYATRSKNDVEAVSTNITQTKEEPASPSSTASPSPIPLEDYDMSMAAVHWVDTGVSHYRVFFQPTYLNETRVLESSWSSNNKTWVVSPISESGQAIKPNAPIAAVAGIPHTDSYKEYMVNNVYFPSTEETIIERQTPFKRRLGQWGDNDETYHKVPLTSNSSVCAYWWQDFELLYLILATFYQKSGADTLTIRSYAEAGPDVEDSKKHDWRNVTKILSMQDGSPMAVAPRSAGPNIMMYLAASNGTLKQVPIDLETDEFGVETVTDFKLTPHSPFCVSTEDNRNQYTDATLPQCARTTDPLTHLILFATEDRKDLKLLSWNCTSGFVDTTSRIRNLLKPDRKYLSVATSSGSNLTFVDQRVYVLYDSGKDEPTMEEWKIPDSGKAGGRDQNGPWLLNGEVPIKP